MNRVPRLRFAFPLLCMAMCFTGMASAADIVFYNGLVRTMDDQRTTASAVVVANGTITYVGQDETANPVIPPRSLRVRQQCH